MSATMHTILDGCEANAKKLCADVKEILDSYRYIADGHPFLIQRSPKYKCTLLFHLIDNIALKAETSCNYDKEIRQMFRLPRGMLFELELLILKTCDFKIYNLDNAFQDFAQKTFRGLNLSNHAGKSS